MSDTAVRCPYCGKAAIRVRGAELYPRRDDLHHKPFYACMPCGAWVGCHSTTGEPLGRLSDSRGRRLKSLAHNAFDPIWQKGARSRAEAYAWLAERLGINPDDCHIGKFDEAQCLRVMDICRDAQRRLLRP